MNQNKPVNIHQLLKKRYPEGQYALMAEVRDEAGFNANRSADFIAVSLWPSRGLGIYGIELKSFRSDWLNELKKPKKAENIFQYCNYFYLLTTDDTIAKIEEIPETWGWLCVKGSKIITIKEAPKQTPIPVSNNFLACMLKRACDKSQFVHVSDIEDRIKDANENGKNESKRTIESVNKELKDLTDAVYKFKQVSGIDLKGYYRWNNSPEKMGKLVHFLENGGVQSIKDQLIGLEVTAKVAMQRIEEGLKLFSLMPKEEIIE